MSISLVQQVDRRGFGVQLMGMQDLVELNRARWWINEVMVRESISYGDTACEEGIVLADHWLWRCPMFLPAGQVNRSAR